MSLTDTEIKKLILRAKLVSRKDFEHAAATARHLGAPVVDVLTGRNFLSEDELGKVLAKHYKVKYVDLTKVKIPQSTLSLLPEAFAQSMNVVAFARRENAVWAAMVNPRDLEVLDLVRKTIGFSTKVVPFVATQRALTEAARQYKKTSEYVKGTKARETEGTSAVTTIEQILDDAVADNSSDIHIEPLDNETLVRFRIDGVLHDLVTFPKSIHPTLIARIKILSDLKLDETRLPQDGQFSYLPRSGRRISLRVSTIPTVYGEKAVLRILHDALTTFQLEELGLLPEDLTRVEKVLRRTHGMVLVTGPTGSGKTTTLYTILGLLNKPGVNIMTIEDPVENRIRRVSQIQINPAIHLTFALGLRSMLRQDPDIIMVGEIRDHETSIIAVNASMTGHLVFSSVHANTAATAIPRLIDLGVEPFLIASTLNMVIAQRLVRVLCQHCIEPVPLSSLVERLIKESSIDPLIRARIKENYRSRGCSFCRRTGYRGRVGIFEMLDIDEAVRGAIVSKSSAEMIWNIVRKKGVKSMLEDGLLKVITRQTTVEEVFRVIST